MKLAKILNLNAKIKLLSGLHIGGDSDEIHIGGIDNPVIKNPVDKMPYIPGSSIKGKVRSLLEQSTGRTDKDGSVFSSSDGNDLLIRVFGNGKTNKEYKGGPSRAIFNDCSLDPENKNLLKNMDAITEEKIEVSINRVKGTAISPRHMERIPAGAIFDFRLSLKTYTDIGEGLADDDQQQMLELIYLGFKLLEMDALGGSGSRGYGRVKFIDLMVDDSEVDLDSLDFEQLLEKSGR